MSVAHTPSTLTLAEAARIMREAMRDKSYQLTPLGAEIAGYLRIKRKRLADTSYRTYESSLDKLARFFPDLQLRDLEPPVGVQRIEEYLDRMWGDSAPGTYNRNLSITSDFFDFAVKRDLMRGNPCGPIEPAKKRQFHREVFNADTRLRIIASQDSVRDRLALRLLFDYALRKGSLRQIRFQHFDHVRKRVTIFGKGGKVRDVPLPDPAFWHDLERHILDIEAAPADFLMASFKVIPRGKSGLPPIVKTYPDRPMSESAGMHRWWYGCLQRAGVVPSGVTSGERMHKARHTAGQRVLDATGDLKLVQKLLGHESIRTTGDIYVDYDIDQWAAMLAQAHASEEEGPE